MLTLWGPRAGMDRRGFLKVGALGLAGLSLPNLLRQRAVASTSAPRKSIILFWMAGGPSHLDTYDMKPAMPREVAGPFRPIHTSLPGLQICELLPRQARLAQHFSIIRSLRHEHGVHDDASHWVQTGYPLLSARERGQRQPAQGAVVARLLGARQQGIPPYVCIPEAYSSPQGFYQMGASLGARYNPINGGGDPSLGNYRRAEFTLPVDLTVERLQGRRGLADHLDSLRRRAESGGAVAGMDAAQQQAFDLITGPRAREAFDVTREPATLRDRYGRHAYGQGALLARRLVEAGVTFVTVNLYERDVDWWDDHYNIETNLRRRLPRFDQALASLQEDLHQRGRLDDVIVAAFGEFGRTPRIDQYAGRSHWPWAMSALLAGGGLRGGQIVGATNHDGGRVYDRPVGPGDLLATLYRAVGINPEISLPDQFNRPLRIVDHGQPIAELF